MARIGIRASLHIRGDDLDPEEITGLLGVSSSSARRRGESFEPILRRRGQADRYTFPSGQWVLSSALPMTAGLSEQISEILDHLPDDDRIWSEISDRFETYIVVGIPLGNEAEDFELDDSDLEASPAVATRLALRGLEIRRRPYRLPGLLGRKTGTAPD